MSRFEVAAHLWVDILEPASWFSRNKLLYEFADGPRKWQCADTVVGTILERQVQLGANEQVLLTIAQEEACFAVSGLRGWRATNSGVAIPREHLDAYNADVARQLNRTDHTIGFAEVFDESFRQLRQANATLQGTGIPEQSRSPYYREFE